MARVPLLVTLLPQLLMSALLVVVIIVMFTQMHNRAITSSMETSVLDALRFAEQRIVAPFTRLRADTLLAREIIVMNNAYAWREDKTPGWMYYTAFQRPWIEAAQQMIHANDGLYPFVYQTSRYRNPYPSAPNGTHDNQDFGWADTGSGPFFSTMAVDLGDYYVFNQFGRETYPFVNMTVEWSGIYDGRETAYTQFITTLTNSTEDRDGRWGVVEAWMEYQYVPPRDPRMFVLYTYSIPLTWDPVTGMATSAVSIDIDCATWLVDYINNLNVAATEFTLIEPQSMQVLASSFPALRPGMNSKNVSDLSTWVLWNPLSSPEPRLSKAMNEIAAATAAPWTALPEQILVFPDGSDDIFSARAMRQSGLNLVIVSVTRRSHFFTEGDTAERDAIIVSCVLLVLSLILAVATADFLRRPLKRLGYRMQLTASLNDDVTDDTVSVVKEVAEMQIAYEQMKAELKRVKSFLPQSILLADKMLASGSCDAAAELMLRSIDEPQGCCGAVDSKRLRAAINEFTCQDCVVVIITVAYSAPIGTASHSICVEVLLDAVIRGVARYRGVVEQMRPHQVIVSFGARRKISNPTNSALKFAFGLNSAVKIPEVEMSMLLDRGTFFIGSCGNDDLRQETITSSELDALLSLGPLVHSKHRVSIAATDRVAPSLTEHCAVFPIDNVQWGGNTPVHLHQVIHIEASLLAACDGRILSHLKRGFGLMCNGDQERALTELKEGQGLMPSSSVPEAVEALYVAAGNAFTALIDVTSSLADSSQAYVLRYLGWPTLDGSAPLTAEFDGTRCETDEDEHHASHRLQSQLQQLTKLKENRVPRFSNPFRHNPSAKASGLFEMAFAVDVDALTETSGNGYSTPSGAEASSAGTIFNVENSQREDNAPLPRSTQYLRHWRRGEHVLGKGTFGCVYRALHDNGSIAAMKILPLCATTTDLDDLKKELVVSAGQRHENLVQFVDAEVGTEELVVIMELLPGGSLESLVNDFGALPPRVVRRFVVDILQGLSHLHRGGIVHCDVKPQNVLVGVDGVAKVADFGSALHPGFAANHGKDDSGDLKVPGTPAYMAPEVARGGAPTPASDIWSFGVMLHELLAQKRPFNEKQNHQMEGGAFKCISVVGGIREAGEGLRQPPRVDLPVGLDDREATEQFVQACLSFDPQRRPTCEKLLSMEYLL